LYRFRAGIGHSNAIHGTEKGIAGQITIIRHLGFTNEGLLSHDFETGGFWADKLGSYFIAYHLNIEGGKHYLSLSLGPSWTTQSTGVGDQHYTLGWYAGLNIGSIVASGGGVHRP